MISVPSKCPIYEYTKTNAALSAQALQYKVHMISISYVAGF